MVDIRNLAKNYFSEVTAVIDKIDPNHLERVIDVLVKAYDEGKTVFAAGNGGSASLASHFACDLGKNTLRRVYDNTEKRFRVISLTDNISLMTAYINDLSFDDVFVQQLRNLIGEGDVLFVISGSGSSPNLIKAVKYAKRCGAVTIGLLAFKTGGRLGSLVDHAAIIDSDHYGIIEGVHTEIIHFLVEAISQKKREKDGLKDRLLSRAGVMVRGTKEFQNSDTKGGAK